MAVEASGPISALNPAWPLEADEIREGAAHIRVVKETLQIQFPNLNAATPRTPDEVNALIGASEASPIQAQLTSLQNQINALDKPAVGDLKFSTNGSPGADWVPCNFAERTRGDELWAIIGTTWGVGDGSTTYNVPDFRGRGPKGVGDLDGDITKGYPLAEKGGAEDVLLTGNQSGVQPHTHLTSRRTTGATYQVNSGPTAASTGTENVSSSAATAADALEAHENRSPYLSCYVYIRFQVTTA